MEILVEKEIIGYGPASTIATTLTNIPAKPRSLKIFIDVNLSSLITAIDDGAGNIIGTGVTGTISYSTGEISLTLSTSIPDDTHYAFISYTYYFIGVTELNKVQYSNQDFLTNVEELKEYIRKNYPDDYNDYVNSSLGMALIDINAYTGQNLSWYMNRKITDLYFPTARTPNAVAKLSRTLGYKPAGARSAQVNLGVTLSSGPYTFQIKIEKPFAFKGPNGLQFEYRNNVPIVFNAGEVYKTFDVNEGESVVDNFIATGETNQVYYLRRVTADKFIEEGSISISINGIPWTEYPIIPFENITAFETNILSTPPYIKFGDGIQGQIPANGLGIAVSYVICNGFNGRIVKDSISKPLNPLNVNFTEIPLLISQNSASIGGENPEDLRSITVNAPLFQKTQDRAITKDDYDYLANLFPNVAMADAQTIRSITNDYNIQQFLKLMNSYILNLKNADRYLTPRPQIQNIVLSENLFAQNVVAVTITPNIYSQVFTTDNTTTLNDLAALLAADSHIASAIVRESAEGNVIVLTGKVDTSFAVPSLSVTPGTTPMLTVTQLTPAPNQIQVMTFDRDLFYGNVVSVTYDTTSFDIPFTTDSATTLQAIGSAIAAFAKAPQGKWKEITTAPHQTIELKFDKDFFNGCLLQLKIKDLSQETPVDTLVETSFRTDNATTYADIYANLAKLSFVKSVTGNAVLRTITIETDSEKPTQLSNEIVGFGDGSKTVYSFTLANTPIKPNSVKIVSGGVTTLDTPTVYPNGTLGTVGATGSINYETGVISLTYSVAPAIGITNYASYTHYSSLVSLEVSLINTILNTVTVDETLRTITVISDSAGTLALSGSVSAKAAPTITTNLLQSMILEDLGSIGAIATSVEEQVTALETYLAGTYSDGCRSNTVQVSVLSLDAAKKYTNPTQTLLDNLNTFLSARKDIVHKVVTITGYDKVINVDMDVEVLVAVNSVQDEVVKKVERSLIQSDSLPYGLMVQRDFNKSLYVSEVFDAIEKYIADSERDYVNIVIKEPRKHSTGYIEDELIGMGVSGVSELLIVKTLKNNPVVENELKINVSGIEAGYDNGEGSVIAATGSFYSVEGMVDYKLGTINIVVTPPPPVDTEITATYYKNMIDARGNYICPQGYVLQHGTVTVKPLSRGI